MNSCRKPRFERIGDIAIIPADFPPGTSLMEYASAIRSCDPAVRLVVAKVSRVRGTDRTASLITVSGHGGTVTIHREFGFSYRLDVEKAFFNPRLASERNRVAGLVRPGERVLVPFAGVGPFAIPAAARGATVLALDSNRDACRWCLENVRLNRVGDTVSVVCGDARMAPSFLSAGFDRIISPTPYGLKETLQSLKPLAKPGCRVHWYTFAPFHEILKITDGLASSGWIPGRVACCGNVAPGIGRFVFDLELSGCCR